MRFSILAAMAAAATLSLLAPALAHEGHDHGESKAPPLITSVASRGEAVSDNFELVVVARGETLDIFVDRFVSNDPVEGATIEVETPSGPTKATANRGQAYTLAAPWLAKAGEADLIFTVTANGMTDVLPVSLEAASAESKPAGVISSRNFKLWALGGALVAAVVFGGLLLRKKAAVVVMVLFCALALTPAFAHEGKDHGEQQAPKVAQTTDLAQRQPDGSVFVPKPVQRIFALRTMAAKQGEHYKSIELPGKIIPDPNASGHVQSAIGGRLSAPPGGFPRLGTQVKKGDVLAYVTPPLQAIDVSDMRQRQGELDQQISIVERRLARFEQLTSSGAVARSQLEDTRSELEGLRERRAMLDKTRREPEALVAPVSGVVADGNAVAGQIAQPNSIIFQIVDPAKLWVEALSFEIVSDTQQAFAQTAAGKTIPLSHRGSGFADRSQSIPVHFAVEGENAGLRAGQFVTVLVRTDDAQKGIVIPRSALVRAASGQDVVYEHISPERFRARIVRTAPFDGNNVLVLAGLESGKRIVVQGAELLDHVR